MRVLVVGASGLLGRALVRHPFASMVLGTAYRRHDDGTLPLDARDQFAVRALLVRMRPAVVINAAGERRHELWDDSDVLRAANVTAAVNIARECNDIGAWLIHVSSDSVFDGASPPYAPDDIRRPLNNYGLTKLEAEDEVRRADPRATILRVPVLYGPVERLDESDLTSLVPAVLDRTPRSIDHWALRYPTLTTDVAHVVGGMIGRATDLQGTTCHWSAVEGLTTYEMARRIGGVLGRSTNHLRPDPSPADAGSRPREPRLDCSLLEGLGVGRRTPLDAALGQLLPGVATA